MKPVMIARYFGDGVAGEWGRLARACAYSAHQHLSPAWDVDARLVTPEQRQAASGIRSHSRNTEKMDEWWAAVEKLPDGARFMLIDMDTVILRPLDDIWEQDFDWAYTVKQSKFPYNSGVVLGRLTTDVRRLIERWWHENDRLCKDWGEHEIWRKQFGGINQAALGHMIVHKETAKLKALELPCAEWNCEDSTWAGAAAAPPRILHLKGRMRRAALDYDPRHPEHTDHRLRWGAATWYAYACAAEHSGAMEGHLIRPDGV